MTVKSILFDFDGVILDSVASKTNAFYEMYLLHGKSIAEKVVAHHKQNGGMSRFEKFRLYHKNFLGIELSEAEVQNLSNQFSCKVTEEVIKSHYIPGVLEFIRDHQGIFKMWVITATPQAEIDFICSRLGITNYFEKILGSPARKTELLQSLIQDNEILPSECVFIGDSPNDQAAADSANIKFILLENSENVSYFGQFHGIRIKNFLDFDRIINAD